MPINDRRIKNAKPTTDKLYKLADGNDPYLQVTPTDGKPWRFDYIMGKRQFNLVAYQSNYLRRFQSFFR